MRYFIRIIPVALAAVLFGAAPANAQNTPAVFLDCNGENCNQTYFRTEITWVNWVRDRADSDIHLIFTSEGTGSGGRIYQLDFLGQAGAEGYEEQIRLPTSANDTEREELDAITSAIALGIAQFAATQGFGGLVRIEAILDEVRAAEMGVVSADEVSDPWNLWTFNLGGNANLSGEDTRSNRRIRSSFNASRVSPTWKLNFRGDVNYNRRQIELSTGPDFVDTRTDWGITGLAVYSVADRWSVGARAEARRIVSFNQSLRWEVTPAVEYSFFPYEEATRRALVFYYQIGPAYRQYIETTVFGEDEETRWEQQARLRMAQRQPWGEANFSLTASHFLHDTSLYNVSLNGGLEFRIVRGLSLDVGGRVSWVQDQIYLQAGDATSEEELLDLVRRSQSFTWGFDIGFGFRFGSIFNNVVNNRFSNPRGGG